MSRWINLSNSKGRNARVRMEAKQAAPSLQFQTGNGQLVKPARIMKTHLSKSYSHLISQCESDEELARYLIESDPEIDLEAAGRRTGPTDRVLLDHDERVLYTASEIEVITDKNGLEIQRREPTDTPANIDTQTPLVWTGKLFKRTDAVRQFAFSRNYQIRHVDGLTFDFLYAIAQKLDRLDSLVVIGTGGYGKEPLILERNGFPYRGFLEGRARGEKYLLILHLSHLELSGLRDE